MCSVDGRTITQNWGKLKGTRAYEQVHQTFNSQAWLCGRVTMEKDFASDKRPDLQPVSKEIIKEDYIADPDANSFAIAIDKDGRLFWDEADIDGDHIIEVLSENVSSAYLAYLKKTGISYIFAGQKEIDLKGALTKLGKLFPIKTMMLEGGGHLNGAMLEAGLIDEVSVLHVPVADGTQGAATVFEKSQDSASHAHKLKLIEVKQLEDDVIWTHYRVEK